MTQDLIATYDGAELPHLSSDGGLFIRNGSMKISRDIAMPLALGQFQKDVNYLILILFAL